MIRLVTCDIDGTLLHGEEWTIDAETLQEIERLRAKGILFCPASGRQHNSLRRLFGPMQNEIAYICENGAVVFGPGNPGPVWGKVPLDRAQALQLSREIMAMPECEVCISGENTSYLHTRDEAALRFMREGLGNRVAVIDDPAEIQEEIIKVSVFAQRGTAAVIDDLQERWGTIFQVAVAGKQWIDCTLADKGTGLQLICKTMGVKLEEVMSFGDNYNDVPLLSLAGHPYIMDNAVQELRDRFPNHCRRVIDVLKTL